ncbi:Mo-dependent nitrogenase C-terminal domain-containing protein [Allocoleopsis franciscana]|uniref:Mo-dependent nitrogenase n=1 Tax=Allocoleopsis franciscana PCC 7113 TaxID=1173027 RepID=K9W9W9_9CYAN|nr:Mo-dependent nitrogenase C-terminal domain-containing protein [Allocoleopsis franciscana]AFZ17175.1 Mo-dependent nitrogenase [Allocoleopsis franciscana PCC 7113]
MAALTPTHQTSQPSSNLKSGSFDILYPLRRWLDGIQIKNAKIAQLICKLIPVDCPFERDVVLLGRTLFHIPPMCKLNPLYDQFVGLRFRALSFLCEECMRMPQNTSVNCSNCSFCSNA